MKHLSLSPELYDYLLRVSVKEHPVLQALREATASHNLALMQIPPEQAQFLQWLLRLLNAKKVLELGTFTGYSALAMALALPDDGKLITCDCNAEWTKNAAAFWQQAGQEDKIELRLAKALDSIKALLAEGQAKSFDFIFIDADKTNYLAYYEYALELIKPSGLIAIDNMLWSGKVVDPAEQGAQVRDIRKLNERIKEDPRVEAVLLPIADGLFLCKPKS